MLRGAINWRVLGSKDDDSVVTYEGEGWTLLLANIFGIETLVAVGMVDSCASCVVTGPELKVAALGRGERPINLLSNDPTKALTSYSSTLDLSNSSKKLLLFILNSSI